MSIPEGTAVWCRVPGYPFWPAKIVSAQSAPKSVQEEEIPGANLVQFFSTNEYSWAYSDDISYPFSRYHEAYSNPSTTDHSFKKALIEAQCMVNKKLGIVDATIPMDHCTPIVLSANTKSGVGTSTDRRESSTIVVSSTYTTDNIGTTSSNTLLPKSTSSSTTGLSSPIATSSSTPSVSSPVPSTRLSPVSSTLVVSSPMSLPDGTSLEISTSTNTTTYKSTPATTTTIGTTSFSIPQTPKIQTSADNTPGPRRSTRLRNKTTKYFHSGKKKKRNVITIDENINKNNNSSPSTTFSVFKEKSAPIGSELKHNDFDDNADNIDINDNDNDDSGNDIFLNDDNEKNGDNNDNNDMMDMDVDIDINDDPPLLPFLEQLGDDNDNGKSNCDNDEIDGDINSHALDNVTSLLDTPSYDKYRSPTIDSSPLQLDASQHYKEGIETIQEYNEGIETTQQYSEGIEATQQYNEGIENTQKYDGNSKNSPPYLKKNKTKIKNMNSITYRNTKPTEITPPPSSPRMPSPSQSFSPLLQLSPLPSLSLSLLRSLENTPVHPASKYNGENLCSVEHTPMHSLTSEESSKFYPPLSITKLLQRTINDKDSDDIDSYCAIGSKFKLTLFSKKYSEDPTNSNNSTNTKNAKGITTNDKCNNKTMDKAMESTSPRSKKSKIIELSPPLRPRNSNSFHVNDNNGSEKEIIEIPVTPLPPAKRSRIQIEENSDDIENTPQEKRFKSKFNSILVNSDTKINSVVRRRDSSPVKIVEFVAPITRKKSIDLRMGDSTIPITSKNNYEEATSTSSISNSKAKAKSSIQVGNRNHTYAIVNKNKRNKNNNTRSNDNTKNSGSSNDNNNVYDTHRIVRNRFRLGDTNPSESPYKAPIFQDNTSYNLEGISCPTFPTIDIKELMADLLHKQYQKIERERQQHEVALRNSLLVVLKDQKSQLEAILEKQRSRMESTLSQFSSRVDSLERKMATMSKQMNALRESHVRSVKERIERDQRELDYVELNFSKTA